MGHLIIGLIIGFILFEIFHARTVIFFCTIRNVLQDSVDKLPGRIGPTQWDAPAADRFLKKPTLSK